MKKLLVAAIVVLMASPAFAAIQNVKVSGDVTTTFLDRSDFNLGDTQTTIVTPINADLYDQGLKKQNVFLTQTRLRVDADLSDNVSTTVALINERSWNGSNTDTNVQLYLASVTMRELLYSPLSVTVGRQIFTYGNGLVLGNGPNNQTNGGLQNIAQDLGLSSAEDGIKAVLDYKPLTIDLIYYKNDQSIGTIRGLNQPASNSNQSSEVFGYNANYQLGDAFNTVIEQYMFNRIGEAAYIGDTAGLNSKGDQLYVPGLRASTNPIKGLNVQGELAWQLGDQILGNGGINDNTEAKKRDAMAAQVLASYALPVLEKYKPTVNASYTYLSGDKMSEANAAVTGNKDAKHDSAWDVFAGDLGAGTIYSSIYPLTNMSILSAGASVNPLEDVTTSFTWSNLWANDRYTVDNPLFIYQPNEGSTSYLVPTTDEAYSNNKKDARGLGNEFDLNMTYNYTEDVTFGVSLGWYVPGSALYSQNRDAASQAIASLGVKF
jgi:hypothetical protein